MDYVKIICKNNVDDLQTAVNNFIHSTNYDKYFYHYSTFSDEYNYFFSVMIICR